MELGAGRFHWWGVRVMLAAITGGWLLVGCVRAALCIRSQWCQQVAVEEAGQDCRLEGSVEWSREASAMRRQKGSTTASVAPVVYTGSNELDLIAVL